MPLSIRVQFLAGYSGREWPPSPARLFKALVSAGRNGWAASKREAIDGALRKLEGTAPVIAAPEAVLRMPGQRRFVPNNSKNWPTQRKLNPVKGIDLEPESILRWDLDAPATIWYQWPDAPAELANIVRELARHTWSVGKGEDFALVDVLEAPPPPELIRWREATGQDEAGAWLEIPDAGCLAVCDAMFSRSAHDPPLPASGTRSVRYTSSSAIEVRHPVSVLALWWRGKRRSCDARLLRQVVGPIRKLLDEVRGEVVDVLAGDSTERARLDALTQRVLLGHDECGDPVREPHLAVLPLPSVLGPYPDGRIRRVALVDLGCGQDPARRTIFELTQILLHGRELLDHALGTGVRLETEPDQQWLKAVMSSSRTWVSVTPVIQPAKELTSAEWSRLRAMRRAAAESAGDLARLEQRLRDRRLELVVRSLTQAVGTSGAQPVSVEVMPSGPIAGVHLARHYRVDGYLADTPRWHLRVTFDRPVTGPLAVGRGRHVGFGLLWPEAQPAESTSTNQR
ncbi:MAG: type I-U CRISPR-associated protein Csb2 [Bryobacteraceae bacterium]|nr:type I-U CRISPR-associated protein Csb2 [Bryobacteraceae bacterium]MDW8378828.1 type I-U CRISPR-associated protein Csb2 [Bryobacterales bacterium]